MSKTTPLLDQVYLLSGYPEFSEGDLLKPETVELVTEQTFGIKRRGGKFTLCIADDLGRLASVTKAGSRSRSSNQLLARKPLDLRFVPQEAVKYAYFADSTKWQKKVIDQLNAINDQPSIETLPVRFTKDSLRKNSNGSSEDHDHFHSGKEYCGHVIPRVQFLSFLFPVETLRTGQTGNPSTIEITLPDGEQKYLQANQEQVTLEYTSEFDGSKKTETYIAFILTGIEGRLGEGDYGIRVRSRELRDNLQPWCRKNGNFLSFTCSVSFALNGIGCEFDAHLLSPSTLEETFISQFPHYYSHLQSALQGQSDSSISRLSLDRPAVAPYVARLDWAKGKAALVNQMRDPGATKWDKTGGLVRLGLDTSLRLTERGSEKQKLLESAQSAFNAVTAALDVKGAWASFMDNIIADQALKQMAQSIDVKLADSLYEATRWKRVLLKSLGSADTKAEKIRIVRQSIGEVDNKYIYYFGTPKATRSFADMTSAKAVGKSLAALDVAMTIYNYYSLFHERMNLVDDYTVQSDRLSTGLDNYYKKKYHASPNLDAIKILESMRRTTDMIQMDLDKNTKELIHQAVDTTLGLASYVPAIGQASQCILLAKAALGAAKNFGAFLGTTLDAYVLDNLAQAYRNQRGRLNTIEQENSLNIRAIHGLVKAGKRPDDVAVQFRVRAAVLNGLFRLIERCGSRHDSPQDFTRKFNQYRIDEYIRTFISEISPSEKVIFDSELPLDEVWLFCKGNKAGYGLEKLERLGKILFTDEKSILPFGLDAKMLANAPVAVISESVRVLSAPRIPMAYQRAFPIHYSSASSMEAMARTLNVNFSAVGSEQLVFGRVYVLDGKKWVPAENHTKQITPFDQVRVVVVFKGEDNADLSGLPISMQCVRTDTILDIAGPVYKGCSVRTFQTKNDGKDKGLLPEEEEFLSTETESFFGYVFHPFYYFAGHLYKGIKPLGTIAFSADPELRYAFQIKAGRINKPIDIAGNRSVRVTVPTLTSAIARKMVQDDAFCDNKTDKITHPKITVSGHEPEISGYFLKRQGRFIYVHAGNKHYQGLTRESRTLAYNRDFDFEWYKPFEVVFLFYAGMYNTVKWPMYRDGERQDIKFPVTIKAKEKNSGDGPSYAGEVYLLRSQSRHNKWELEKHTINDMAPEMKRHGILRESEWVENGSMNLWNDTVYEGNVFALRMDFDYTVANAKGDIAKYNAFKPFAKEYIVQNNERGYVYEFEIQDTWNVGFKVSHSAEFHLPGFYPKPPSNMPFLGNREFVTRTHLWKLLNIQHSDYH